MNIRVRDLAGIVILDLDGNIDINASDFIEIIGETLTTKTKNIICNFAEVNLVDYVGISVITIAYKNVLNHEGTLRFYNVAAHVKKLFSVVGLERVLEIFDSQEQALASFSKDNEIKRIAQQQLRRRFKRIPLNVAIEYKQKFSPRNVFYKGHVINLSAIGVFISGSMVFALGDILSVKIHLEPAPGIIMADAKVVWLVDEEIQPQESVGMGLEFYKIDLKEQQIIVEFVEKHLTGDFQE
jgi:anti-anti-sigma factor